MSIAAASSRRRVRTDSEAGSVGPRSAKQTRLADGGYWALAQLASSLFVVLSKASPCEGVQRVSLEPACHDSSLFFALADFPSVFRACPPTDAIPRLVAFSMSYHPCIAKHYLSVVSELRFSATEPPYPFLQVNEYQKIIRMLQRVGHYSGPTDITSQSAHEAITPIRIGFQRLIDGSEKYRTALVAANQAIRAVVTVLPSGAPSFLMARFPPSPARVTPSLGKIISDASATTCGFGVTPTVPCGGSAAAEAAGRSTSCGFAVTPATGSVPRAESASPCGFGVAPTVAVLGTESASTGRDARAVSMMSADHRSESASGPAEPRVGSGTEPHDSSAPAEVIYLPWHDPVPASEVICLPWNDPDEPAAESRHAPRPAPRDSPCGPPDVICLSTPHAAVPACNRLVDIDDVDRLCTAAKWVAAGDGPGFLPPAGRHFKAGLAVLRSSEDPTLRCTAGQLVLVDPALLAGGEGRVHFDARYLGMSKLQPCPVAIFVAGHEIGASSTTVELTPFRPVPESLKRLTRNALVEIAIAEDEHRGSPRAGGDRVPLAPLTTYRATSRALLGTMRWRPWSSPEETWCRRWLRAPRGRATAASPPSGLPAVDYTAPCIVAIGERDWVVTLTQGRGFFRRIMLQENGPAAPLPSRWRPRLSAPIDAYIQSTTTPADMRIRFTAAQVATRQVYGQSCTLLEWSVTVNTLCAAAPFLPTPSSSSAPLSSRRSGGPPASSNPIIVHVPAAPSATHASLPSQSGPSADVLQLTAKVARAEGMLQGQGAALHVYRLAATDVKEHEYARWQRDERLAHGARPAAESYPAASPAEALANELLVSGLEKPHLLRIAEALLAEDVGSLEQLRQLPADVVLQTCCPTHNWCTLGKALARQKFELWLKELP